MRPERTRTSLASHLQAPVAPKSAARARRRRQVRRRRATALIAAGAVLALVALIATGGDHHSGPAGHGRLLALPPTRPAHRSVGLLTRENLAIDRLLTRQPFIASGGGERREIALTFDDGPGPYTPRLLEQLQRLHAPATFFEIGFMISYFHASLERELQMGMAIGDHTELHPMMAKLTPAAQQRELLLQTEWLGRYGAEFPRLYRPHTAPSTPRRSGSCTSCTW